MRDTACARTLTSKDPTFSCHSVLLLFCGLALIFSADIHQGDERFSVHSRGKQCAFMSLSALLTARNIPLNLWSRITFKYALLQRDNMFLNALDSGLIILELAVEFLSVENLPTVVNVACCTNLLNDFSYEICHTSVQAKTTASHR